MAENKGHIIGKNVPRGFEVAYQCVCGMPLYFVADNDRTTCSGCKTEYQYRIMIGRARALKGGS